MMSYISVIVLGEVYYIYISIYYCLVGNFVLRNRVKIMTDVQ